jgi:hypothetical protein
VNAPLPQDLQAAAQADAETAENALALIKATPITTPELFVQAGEELKEIKAEAKRITEVRDAAIKPILASVAMIKSWFTPALDRLSEAEKLRKDGIAGYLQREAEAKQKALEATRAAVLSGDSEAATAALMQTAPSTPKVSGVTSVDVYKFEVTDAAQLPREFLIPDEKAIGALVRAKKGQIEIPGVRVWTEKSIRAGSK